MLGTAERIRQEGMAEGFEQGLEQGRLEIAVNMLRKKYLVEDISECSGLPFEQVKELAANL